jgi:hypothetical protein
VTIVAPEASAAAGSDGAPVAHRRIADIGRQRDQRGISPRALGHLGVGGGRADAQAARVVLADAADLVDGRQTHQPVRRGQTLLQRRYQRLHPAKRLVVLALAQQLDRVSQRRGAVDLECIHDGILLTLASPSRHGTG